jgi:hypothetical protein
MLIVIGVIALLLGIGLGTFTRMDFGERVAASTVQNIIRTAQNWSIARQAPARVLIDRKEGTLRAEGLQVIGTWHFEKLPIAGALGLDGLSTGGQIVEDGYQGRALSFAGEPTRSHVEIAVQRDSAYDLARGFLVRCAIRPASSSGGLVLSLGGVVGLETNDEGGVHGWFVTERIDERGTPQKGGKIPLETPPHLLTPGRWSLVELRYDRHELELLVDDVLCARVDENASVWKLEGPLILSPGQTPFPGALDSLVVGAVEGDEDARLPNHVTFAKDTPREIAFQAGGGLDRERHRERVIVTIEFEDGHKSEIVVQPYGTVE